MLRLDYHGNTKWIKHFLQAILDLGGQTFLQLQTAGESLHHTRNLAQTHNGTVRDITHMRFAEEGQ